MFEFADKNKDGRLSYKEFKVRSGHYPRPVSPVVGAADGEPA